MKGIYICLVNYLSLEAETVVCLPKLSGKEACPRTPYDVTGWGVSFQFCEVVS